MITPAFGLRIVSPTAGDGNDDKSREQRRHPRRSLPVRCWIAQGDHTVYLRLHDVSLGGLSVRAPVPFSAGAELALELELPSGRRVLARACVVWSRHAEASGPRMGASFTEFLSGQDDLQRLLLDARPPLR